MAVKASPYLLVSQIRVAILTVCSLYFLESTFHRELFPYGSAQVTVKVPSFASMDRRNDSLQLKHQKTKRIYERLENDKDSKDANGNENTKRLLIGHETLVVGKDGTVYAMTEKSHFLQLSDFKQADGKSEGAMTAKATFLHHLGPGRPLGGEITPDGSTLYFADALLGLARIQNFQDPTSKVEVVASWVSEGEQKSQILLADDVAIGPVSGKVYFTDATDVASDRIDTDSWDVMYAFKLDLMRGASAGRVLVYDPTTEQVEVFAKGFHFANGIAVSQDESFLVFAETAGPAVWKCPLTKKDGNNGGACEKIMHSKDLAGYPDGVDCAPTGKCYIALPSAISPIHKFYNALPDLVSVFVRNMLLLLPKSFSPKVTKYGAVVELDPDTGAYTYIQDPTGQDLSAIYGVTWHDNKLYLGSLDNEYVGVYNL